MLTSSEFSLSIKAGLVGFLRKDFFRSEGHARDMLAKCTVHSCLSSRDRMCGIVSVDLPKLDGRQHPWSDQMVWASRFAGSVSRIAGKLKPGSRPELRLQNFQFRKCSGWTTGKASRDSHSTCLPKPFNRACAFAFAPATVHYGEDLFTTPC